MTHPTSTIPVSVEELETMALDIGRYALALSDLLISAGVLVPTPPEPVALPSGVTDLSMWRRRRGGAA